MTDPDRKNSTRIERRLILFTVVENTFVVSRKDGTVENGLAMFDAWTTELRNAYRALLEEYLPYSDEENFDRGSE